MWKILSYGKESVDKEWLKLTLDRYYHPEKYFTPEEIAIKPTFGELFDSFLESIRYRK